MLCMSCCATSRRQVSLILVDHCEPPCGSRALLRVLKSCLNCRTDGSCGRLWVTLRARTFAMMRNFCLFSVQGGDMPGSCRPARILPVPLLAAGAGTAPMRGRAREGQGVCGGDCGLPGCRHAGEGPRCQPGRRSDSGIRPSWLGHPPLAGEVTALR